MLAEVVMSYIANPADKFPTIEYLCTPCAEAFRIKLPLAARPEVRKLFKRKASIPGVGEVQAPCMHCRAKAADLPVPATQAERARSSADADLLAAARAVLTSKHRSKSQWCPCMSCAMLRREAHGDCGCGTCRIAGAAVQLRSEAVQ